MAKRHGSKILFLLSAVSLSSLAYRVKDDHDAMMYLNRFGYIDDTDVASNMDMSRVKPKLMEFQKMCNINTTGILDTKTMEMMNAPRCGNLDMDATHIDHHTMYLKEMAMEGAMDDAELDGVLRRYRRFAINDNGYRWKKRELTYKMAMFSIKENSKVSEEEALKEVHRAFKMWQEVTNLDFIHTPKKKKVDIELSFTERFHTQDAFPFDGPGNTLAHAFPPGEGLLGDVHFEEGEPWSVNSPKGINVLFVAVHEIGHALGLSHSSTKGAIMQPFYGGYHPKLRLHKDDIAGIQSLYGKRETRQEVKPSTTSTLRTTTTTTTERYTRPTTTATPRPPLLPRITPQRFPPLQEGLRPDLCKDSSIDAITAFEDGSVYAFKGKYVFLLDPKGKGVIKSWPHRIETVFKGVEGPVDAAVTRRKGGKTYIFKGEYYWRFSGIKPDPGYPKRISIHFKGVPDSVDSAFEWLGAIYFTKRDKIWRFDPNSRPAPNGNIYFFSGPVYWRFDENKFKVNDDLRPTYPRSSMVMWFGCTGGTPIDYREVRQDDQHIYASSLELPEEIEFPEIEY